MLTQTRRLDLSIRALLVAVSMLVMLGPVASAAQKTAGAAEETHAPRAGRINVNTADAKTLQTLPGVGEAIAQRIIEGRPYKSLADLEKVQGLSQTKVAALKGKVSFSEPAAQKAAEAPKNSRHESETSTRSKQAATSPEKKGHAAGATGHGGHEADLAPGEKININTASVEELDRLPGIGRTKGQAIVDYRNANGQFKTLEDIEKVPGIKEGTFSRVKDHIKLNN